MGDTSIQLFDSKKIRTKWDAEQEKWYFSVIAIVEVLTEVWMPNNIGVY